MSAEATASGKKKKDKTGSGNSSLLAGVRKGSKSIWFVAIVCALLAVFATLSILGKAASTTTIYVLGKDVPARTQINAGMLVPLTTSKGGEPRNALDITALASGTYYSKVALKAGDIVSPSNAGPLERINANLPDGFVAASFTLAAENAVAGKITTGDKIDVFATNAESSKSPVTKMVLHNVLVLDVAIAPENIASAANSGEVGSDIGAESNAIRSGIPSLYTVGVSAQDAAKIAAVRGKNLFLVLSANKSDANLDVSATLDGVFNQTTVTDSSAGIAVAPADDTTGKPAGTTGN